MSTRPEGTRAAGTSEPTSPPALHVLGAGVAWVVLRPVRVPPLRTPRLLGLPYRPVRLPVAGAVLSGWHLPAPGARAGLVLCHGHNNCRTQFLAMLRPLHAAGFSLLAFDHRSMGTSSGSLCTYGFHEQHDVLAAARWLQEQEGLERVGLYGISMGGASALLAAAAEPGIGAVVTDSAFARLDEVLERHFLYLPAPARGALSRSVAGWCERWSGARVADVAPEAALAAAAPRPVLVIHGGRDLLVPPDHGRRLAAAAGPLAEHWEVPGAGHVACRARAGAEYPRRVTEFFRTHLLGGIEENPQGPV